MPGEIVRWLYREQQVSTIADKEPTEFGIFDNPADSRRSVVSRDSFRDAGSRTRLLCPKNVEDTLVVVFESHDDEIGGRGGFTRVNDRNWELFPVDRQTFYS